MVKVIRADASHCEAIARFNQAMAQETEDKNLAWELIYSGVKALVDNESRGFYLVALDANSDATNAVIGCLGVTYEWSDWRNGMFWWIQSVFVAPDHRGTGTFTAMYARVKSMAQDSGSACGIRLYVERDNVSAHSTYLNLGMVETSYRLMEEEF